jgi:hypothetical protein
MRSFYVQILCKNSYANEWFIEQGILDDHKEYLVYRDLDQGFPECFESLNHFKNSMVHDLKDFKKYCSLVELK